MCNNNDEISRRLIDRFLPDRRFWSRLAIYLTLIFAAASAVAAAQDAGSKQLVVEDRSLTTRDGWRIHMTYFQSNAGKEAPVVLLLHGKGGNRMIWGKKPPPGGSQQDPKEVANRLQKRDFAVITLDLRKHGESKSPAQDVAVDDDKKKTKRGFDPADLQPTDYLRMAAQDLEAVKKFIYEEHQAQRLNMRKLAIVAADMSAPIAINYALADWLKPPYRDAASLAACTPRGQDVRALVLLSPEANLPRLPSGRALAALRNPAWGISFLTCVAADDKLDKGQAEKMYQQLSSMPMNKDRMYLQDKYAGRWRGTDLLGKKNHVEEHMLAFLEKHLKKLPDQWRDRKSRLMD